MTHGPLITDDIVIDDAVEQIMPAILGWYGDVFSEGREPEIHDELAKTTKSMVSGYLLSYPTFAVSIDAYEMACKLETQYEWSPDFALCTILDGMSRVLRSAYERRRRAWVVGNRIVMTLKPNDRVKYVDKLSHSAYGPGRVDTIYPLEHMITVIFDRVAGIRKIPAEMFVLSDSVYTPD